MANSKIQDINLAQLTSFGSFLGVKDNGDGTYTDIRVSAAELVTFVLNNSRKVITAVSANIGAGGTTLTDPFFIGGISEITLNSQCYVYGVDFTLTGSTITGLNFNFYDGQKMVAKK